MLQWMPVCYIIVNMLISGQVLLWHEQSQILPTNLTTASASEDMTLWHFKNVMIIIITTMAEHHLYQWSEHWWKVKV